MTSAPHAPAPDPSPDLSNSAASDPASPLARLTAPHGVRPALLALALGTFTIGTGEFGMMGVLPEFARSLNITLEQGSLVISAYALGVVVGAPVIAVLGARLARRTLLMAMLGLFVIGNVGTVLATSLPAILVMRFITGLPHGVYFGVGALAGATLVDRSHRGRAVGQVLGGIMIATVIGAPLATFVSDHVGWKAVYAALAVLGTLCLLGVGWFLPRDMPDRSANPLTELSVFKSPQVLLTLLTAAVGFGGLFGIYTFLTSALADVTHLSAGSITLYQVVWGLGMVGGNAVGSAMIDRNLDRTTIWSLAASTVFMVAFSFFMPDRLPLLVLCFLVPAASIILSPAMQTRLMDWAGRAQTLAASLNHAAFNLANAFGAWFAGQLVGLWGLTTIGWGGALLSAGGLGIYLVTVALARRHQPPTA
ncbi:MFS transporter [Oecophyllibacter saccharovorans]|uniref:MFS transporter n=1 Tax=Oecophyllibacter saccharovorans TaxID=2558360 RepID=UPI00116C5B27|nr:MFS transporter [Oecophyllibacter saccharovorans]TPW36659.1 MFS transporter [Oecophyllibacter saccharovorans]